MKQLPWCWWISVRHSTTYHIIFLSQDFIPTNFQETCKLVLNYLANRYQNKQNSSDWLMLKTGVPQGFIMAPLMFSSILNDLMISVKKHFLETLLMTIICQTLIHMLISITRFSQMISNLSLHGLLNNFEQLEAVTISKCKDITILSLNEIPILRVKFDENSVSRFTL